MGLADSFAELRPNYGGFRCAVNTALNTMPDTDRAALEAALANPNLQGAGIARVLQDNGYRVGAGALNRHRSGRCSCP